MSSNIVTANADTIIDSLATQAFKNYGSEVGDAAIAKNYFLAVLKQKNKVIEVGGLDFTEVVMKSENTNFAFRSHYTEIPAAIQDPFRQLTYIQAVLDGAVVINKLHKAQVNGKYAIRKLLTDLMMQAETTISNTISTAIWAASPDTSVEPESLVTTVAADPTTGTYGGVNRATNSWARNKYYSTAIADVGSEAGLAVLHSQRVQMGGGVDTSPDIAVTTPDLFGGLYGFMDSKRQLRSDEKVTKLGFDNFYIGTALLGCDPKCTAKYFYYLNSKHLFLKILSTMNFEFDPFSVKDNSLNSTSIFSVAMNLTSNLPSAQMVLSNCTTS